MYVSVCAYVCVLTCKRCDYIVKLYTQWVQHGKGQMYCIYTREVMWRKRGEGAGGGGASSVGCSQNNGCLLWVNE